MLDLRNSDGMQIAKNDNCRSNQEAELKKTGIASSNPKEAALIKTLEPGSYTAILSGAQNSTGAGLAEVYDVTPTTPAELVNLSSRGFVSTGDDVLIGGLIIRRGGSERIFLRAIGPSLAKAAQNPLCRIRTST